MTTTPDKKRVGYHWIGRLPDGEFVLLYIDPILKKVHTEVGRFPDHWTAIRFCRKNRIALESVERIGRNRAEVPKAPLHGNQGRLYHALLGMADDNGIAKVTRADLMQVTKIDNATSFHSAMTTLMLKRVVSRLETGWGEEPSAYQVAVPGEQQKKPPSGEGGQQESGD